jgi:hypothetical protein
MSEVKVNKISPRTNCGTTQLGDAGDTITVTGDLKSNSLKSASGSTITLGQSGDTIQLGCGASQTGFGRTGTVDWDTTAKTASFTAVSGTGYFVNTTSTAITVTLPATPSAGDIVAISDYASTANTNNITIGRNGSNINGSANDYPISTKGLSVTLVYVDGTRGWKSVTGSDTDVTGLDPNFIAATGGTITCCGDYKIHTFTSPGTFQVTNGGTPCGSTTVDYLVVAGGGGGGSGCAGGGGGGAGGMRFSFPNPATGGLPVSAQAYPITVGAGGTKGFGCAGGCSPARSGSKGSDSIFSSITSTGGGLGGAGTGSNKPGGDGGSGGAGGRGASAGSGNTPPVSPSQGNNAGSSSPGPAGNYGAGAGGGHGAVGGNSSGNVGGNGGAGSALSITGASVTYAGGGGGGTFPISCGQPNGGAGGGGRGAPPSLPLADMDGTANTGGGGGGGSENPVYGPIVGAPNDSPGGAGGSGIVVIRYKYQ